MSPTPPTPTPQPSPAVTPPQAPRSFWVKKRIWLLIIFFALTAVIALARPESQSTDRENSRDVGSVSQSARTEQPSKNCVDSDPVFTAAITDLDQIKQIGPLGGLNVGSASRSYIEVKRDDAGQPVVVPVYAPVDSTLTGIYHKLTNYGGSLGSRSEYRLEFEASCDIKYALDHIAFVTDAIKAAGPVEPDPESRNGSRVSIPVKAGEQLGSTNGTLVAGSWDFYVLNYVQKADHINPKRWESEHNLYAVCPYDYYTAELKSQFMAKLGLWDGQKVPGLTCGQIDHDVPGTASGGWFQGDATDMQGTHLFLSNTATMVEVLREVHEQNIERNNPRFGIRTYKYTKMPREMTVGDAVCYSADGKYLFAKLTSAETLQTANGEGTCPATFPTTNIEEWQR